MNAKALTDYLAIVVDMEKDIFARDSARASLRHQYAKLGIAGKFTPPTEPKKPEILNKKRTGTGGDFLKTLLIAAGLFAFGKFMWSDIIDAFVESTHDSGFWAYFFSGAICYGGGLLAFLGCAITIFSLPATLRHGKKHNTEFDDASAHYDQLMQDYNFKMQQYKAQCEEDRKRVARELKRKTALEAQCKLLGEGIDESQSRLRQIYSLNIIHPKYRNLAMVCSIYEYLCTGRCATLEGHEGAYNILEQEMRLDRIVSQLSDVIQHLERIERNQWTLYSAIKEGQKTSEHLIISANDMAHRLVDMGKNIAEIEKNSEITAFNAERTKKELEYMNRMNYYSGHYSGAGNERPPSMR